MPIKDPIRRKEMQRIYQQRYQIKNRDKQREMMNLCKIRGREFIREHKESHPCADCGETNFIVLEFDHISGDKKYNVSEMPNNYHRLCTIKREIAKCEVVCANCHRIRTYNRRNGILPDDECS